MAAARASLIGSIGEAPLGCCVDLPADYTRPITPRQALPVNPTTAPNKLPKTTASSVSCATVAPMRPAALIVIQLPTLASSLANPAIVREYCSVCRGMWPSFHDHFSIV